MEFDDGRTNTRINSEFDPSVHSHLCRRCSHPTVSLWYSHLPGMTEEVSTINNPFLMLPMPRKISRPDSTPSSPTFILNRPDKPFGHNRSLKSRLSQKCVKPSEGGSQSPRKSTSSEGTGSGSRNNSVKKFKKFDFVRHLRRFNTSKNMEDLNLESQRSTSLLRDANDLFAAVESRDLASVREILARRPLLRNCINDLQLSPLDMAMIRGHVRISQLLISQEAVNNPRLMTCMERHLVEMVHLTADEIVSSTGRFLSGSLTSAEAEEELFRLEHSHALVQQLLVDLRSTPPPSPPTAVLIEVSGPESIKISVTPPSSSAVVRYRIEWSENSAFSPLSGSREVEIRLPKAVYQVHKLPAGKPVFVRVSALNLVSWGRFRLSQPASCLPSSWWQVPGCCLRPAQPPAEAWTRLEDTYSYEMAAWCEEDKSSVNKSPLRKRTSFQKLFSNSGSKFVRRPKSGLHLTAVVHCEDKVLMNEESFLHLPVDQDCGGLLADVAWLARLIANSPNLKQLLTRLEKLNTPSSLSTRIQLLNAVQTLQDGLGTLDVGHIYPSLVQESQCTCIVLVRKLESQREVVTPSGFKWTSVYKLHRKQEKNLDKEVSNSSTDEDLISNLEDIIAFSNNTFSPCSPGLYLSFLKLFSTFDSVNVLVDAGKQCMLPSVKLRDNSHVTREEWQLMQDCRTPGSPIRTSHTFHHQVEKGLQRMCDLLDMPDEERSQVRIYTSEVIQLSPRVSIILAFPQDVCCGPGVVDSGYNLEGYSIVSLNAFDLAQFSTFADSWFLSFASLSSALELMVAAAQHAQRQAFSDSEVYECKERLRRLCAIQSGLEDLFKPVRWSLSVISCARDRAKFSANSVSLAQLEQACSAKSVSPISDSSDSFDRLHISSSSGCSSFLSSSFPSPVGQLTPPPPNLPNRLRRKGTLKVLAGYNTGLVEGTSVTLQITAQTTAREVVHLVIGQLNKAVVAVDPAAPYYPPSEFDQFSLVVSAEGLERPLPADFHPLMLQPPWQDGKVTVRHNSDLSPTQVCDADSGIIDL